MATARDIIDRGLEAWRARDADAYAGLFAEDAEISGPGGMELRGPEGARQFMSGWMDAVPDNEVEVLHEYASGSVVVQEGTFKGTHTGDLASPDGQVIPATGRSVEAGYAQVFVVKDDKITSERLYYDQVELLSQLGLMPAPSEAT